MAASGKINVRINIVDSDALDMGGATTNHVFDALLNMATGTASTQINEVWSDAGTVAAGAITAFDVNGGLPAATGDPRGAGITFSKVKLIAIRKTDSGDYMTVGGGTTGLGAVDALAGVDDFPFAADADLAQIVGQNGLYIWYNPEGCTVAAGAAVIGLGGVTSVQEYEILIAGLA